MMFRGGNVLIICDDPTLRGRLGPALMNTGFGATYTTFATAPEHMIEGAVIIDGRPGAKRAAALLSRLRLASRRAVIVLADPREPFVYRTIRETCPGVVLYDPVDPAQVVDVLDNLLSPRKAS